MKRHLIIILILGFVFASCERKSAITPKLDVAQQLMESRTDSALNILDGIKPNVTSESRGVRMRYELMKTEAEDKCYITHTSDSAMLHVVDYYDSHGSSLQKMKAYYILGRVYSDMQLTGEAINAYRKALDIDCKDDTLTYTVRARANNWIGQTLMYQNMYREAYPYFIKSYNFSKLTGNITIEIYSLRDIGRCLIELKQMNCGISCFNRAAHQALETNNNDIYKVVMEELAAIYLKNKNYPKAKQAIYTPYNDNVDKFFNTEQIARYYNGIGKIDSAIIYYNKSLESDNIGICIDATHTLSSIYTKRKNYILANIYLVRYNSYTDSLYGTNIRQNKDLIRILNSKLEQVQTQDRKARISNNIIFALTLLFAITILAIILYIKNKRAKNKIQQAKVKQLFNDLRTKNQDTINSNYIKIAELERTISTLNSKISDYEKSLLIIQKEELTNFNAKIEEDKKLRNMRINALRLSDIYQSFHNCTFNPTESDFVELENQINNTYNNCIIKISELCPSIKNEEIKVCVMIKADIPLKNIALFLGLEQNTLSMLRSRLYKKMFNKKASPSSLDDFIKSL